MRQLRVSLMRLRARWRKPGRVVRPVQPKRRLALLTAGLVIGLLFFYIWTDLKIKPIVKQLAAARVHYLAGITVNDAINEVMGEQGMDYNDLILFEKDLNGRVSAIRTNIAGINKLKTEVCRQVLDNIETITHSDLRIPLGSVFQNDLLAGRGPGIRVRLVPVGSANANIENVFLAAGINQTRHQIVMEISVDMGVLAWGDSIRINVTTQMVVAETVIVGNVPDYYTNITDEIFR